MKSRISFFNPAVVQKNITRFSPLWGLYLIAGLIVVLFMQLFDSNPAQVAADICSAGFAPMVIVNSFYAPLCAILLFGDLFKTRMCYSLHAMPLRREGWFLTNIASGMLFSIGPNLLVALFMMLFCGKFAYVPMAWLLAMTLQFTCFFGMAVLCVHCSGSMLASLALYGLLYFLSMLVLGVIQLVYEPLLFGVVIPTEPFELFNPGAMLINMYIEPNYDNLTRTLDPQWFGFEIGFLWAGVGIVMMVLGMLLYRKRHMETAGDFISFRPIAPVVLVLYTVLVGCLLFVMFSDYLAMAFGIVIGFFTGRMLLERTAKVFRKKNWLGLLAVIACTAISILLTILDPLGIVTWVPETEDVQSVGLYQNINNYYPNNGSATYSAPEEIDALRQVHQFAIEDRRDDDTVYEDTDVNVVLGYQLKNGSYVTRRYSVPVNSPAGAIVRQFRSRPDYLFGSDIQNAADLLAATRAVETTMDEFIAKDQIPGLIAAMEKDWQAGTMAQGWNFHENDDFVLSLGFHLEENTDYDVSVNYVTYIDIFTNNTHTLAWLNANGYLSEK